MSGAAKAAARIGRRGLGLCQNSPKEGKRAICAITASPAAPPEGAVKSGNPAFTSAHTTGYLSALDGNSFDSTGRDPI
jgi:hypothetical protein